MNLVVALTGASGSYAAKAIVERSKWPVTLIASKMGKMVYEQEAGPFEELEEMVDQVWQDGNLAATVSSGSVPTVGMVVAPCSANTLGKVSAGDCRFIGFSIGALPFKGGETRGFVCA
ncbi:MAG: flavoprotein [Pontiellaceae bacterium]